MTLAKSLQAAAGNAGEPTDPQFPYVTMLLHGDGTNGAQNNTFLDASTNNFTITRAGNATQGSFSPYGANWSNYFDGDADYLLAAHSANQQFGTGDFTVECWLYKNNNTGSQNVVAKWATGGWAVIFYTTAGNAKLSFMYGTGSVTASDPDDFPTSQWVHIAVTRSGTSLKLFVNGVVKATATDSYNYNSTNDMWIGGWVGANYSINGYISNLRIVKGTALYTSNFTPSTTPLTAVANTQLLTCQSNRFIDNSANNFTLTRTGDVSVQRFSPFAPTAEYDAATIGGSGYFDGTGDYLSAPDNAALEMGSSDFTMEAWLYPNNNGWQTILTKSADTATAEFQFYAYNNAVNFYGSAGSTWNVGFYTGAVLVPNAWNHVAVTRSGSNWTIWVNGVSQATATASFTISNNTSGVVIGAFTNGVNYANGYLTDVRIVKGTAVYTGAFTPPTAPLTAITNTSLLLNMTNAGIYDNAMMNDLETVGNAQVSTSVKKYGTGSMAFDGNGDWLQAPNTVNADFAGGNFTIEFWIYASIQPLAPIVHQTDYYNSKGWAIFNYGGGQVTDPTRKLCLALNGTSFLLYTSSDAYTDNTWTHIAFVKNGTGSNNITVYSNGVAMGTGTYATDISSSTTPLMVGGIIQGQSWNLTRYLNGYIDDLRITKGYARYTSNFTPPAAAFPNT